MRGRGYKWDSILVTGHVVLYLGLCIAAALGMDELRYIGFAGGALQVLGATLGLRRAHKPRFMGLIGLLVAQLVVLALVAVWRHNRTSFVLYDSLAFALLLQVGVGAEEGLSVRLARIYLRLLPLGVLVSAYLLVQLNPAAMGARFTAALSTDPFYIEFLCAPATYALFVLRQWRPFERFWIGAALGLLLAFGVVTATRSALVVAIAAITIVLVFKRPVLPWIKVFALLSVLGAGLAVVRWSGSDLESSISYTVERFTGDSDFYAGRDAEQENFRAELDDVDWWLGRGLGGTYRSVVGYGVGAFPMVHFGHLHIILKGGVALLSVMGLLTFLAVLNASVLRPDRVQISGEAIYLLVFVLMNLGYRQFTIGPVMSLYAIALGACLRRRNRPQVRVPLSRTPVSAPDVGESTHPSVIAD